MFRFWFAAWLALLPLAGVPVIFGGEAPVLQKWIGQPGIPEIIEQPRSAAKMQASSRHISLKFSGVQTSVVGTGGERVTRLSIANAGLSSEVGLSELPVYRRVLTIAPDAKVTCQATVTATREFTLTDEGMPAKVITRHRPVPKVPGSSPHAPPTGEALKPPGETDPPPTARLVDLGIQRGQRLLLLEVCPLSYDAKAGSVTLCESLEVEFIEESAPSKSSTGVNALTPAATSFTKTANGASPHRLLIISPLALAASLGSFIAHKRSLGWTVDSFTTDIAGNSAESIRAFIRARYDLETTRPSHLLLVGDTDTIPAWSGLGAYLPDTDLYYACMDGTNDWLPDMAVGRFPARTLQQLTNMLSRSIYYETTVANTNPFVSRATFATSEENYTLTEGTHNNVIGRDLNPRAYASQRLYRHTYAATASQITNAVNAGCGLVAYSGHGSALSWLDPLVGVGNVQGLTNGFQCPFVMSFACDTGSYRSYDESFAESWLRKDGSGGALAALASSQDTYWEEDDVFEKCVFASIFEDGVTKLGEAVEAAKMRYLAFYGSSSETLQYFEQYNLFGDPTVALAVPDGNSAVDVVRAVRQLPAISPNSNELFTVSVAVSVTNPVPSGFTLREKLPTSWIVTNALWNGASFSPTNVSGEYRWVFGTNALVRSGTLRYQTRAAGALGATVTFSGTLAYSTNTIPVLGDEELHILPILDADHDGMPDDWERKFALNATNSNDAFLDSDADGVSNLQEYLGDTNPTNAFSNLRLLSISNINDHITLQWRGGSVCTQWVERAERLGVGAVWLPVFTNMPPTPATNTLANTNTLGIGSGFYRVRVRR